MPYPHRRVFLKPPGLTGEQSASLLGMLEKAVAAQRHLAAASPHVLSFVGELSENEAAFFIEHEPAEPISVAELFDSSVEPEDPRTLLRWAAALIDALRVAHSTDGPVRIIHGGICGGVVLRSADGIEKLTDFGFAAAVANALGVDGYMNLAVSARDTGDEMTRATGAWEVLDSDEFERDDRICSFIDPEKYGSQTLTTFEAGSDIIGVGFLLHLFGEHQHAYLEEGLDAHRDVEMSGFMGGLRYNGARRKELRESSDEGVRVWCDLVERMLSRIPANRPTAAASGETIFKFQAPVDAGEILKRRLEILEEQAPAAGAADADWRHIERDAQAIATSDAASPDVSGRARELVVRARSYNLIEKAVALLSTETWREAQAPLDELLSVATLPEDVRTKAAKVAGIFKKNVKVAQELDDVAALLAGAATDAPQKVRVIVDDAIGRLDDLPDDKALVPSLRVRRHELQTQFDAKLGEVKEAAEELRKARVQAEEWLHALEAAAGGEQWDVFDEGVERGPGVDPCPADITAKVDELEQRRADAETAQRYFSDLREAVASSAWPEAEGLLSRRPDLAYWPERIRGDLRDLEQQTKTEAAKLRDAQAAASYVADLRTAASGEDWAAAAKLVASKPRLDHWPENVASELASLESAVKEQEDFARAEAQRAAEAKQNVDQWLQAAHEAGRRGEWREALDILNTTPPDLALLPEKARKGADKQAAELLREYRTKHEEQAQAQAKERDRAVRTFAEELVRSIAHADLEPYVSGDHLKVEVGNVEWSGDDLSATGQSVVSVTVEGGDGDQNLTASQGLVCRMHDGAAVLAGDTEEVTAALSSGIKNQLVRLQKARLRECTQQLSSRLFPDLRIDAKLGGLADRTAIVIDLLGQSGKADPVRAELAWDPAKLAWSIKDPAALSAYAATLAEESIREPLEKGVFEKSDALRQYRSAVSLSTSVVQPRDPGLWRDGIEFDVTLALRGGEGASVHSLQTFRAKCARLGSVTLDTDLKDAERALVGFVVAAQNQALARTTRDLTERIKRGPAKVKLIPDLKRIKQPVDRIEYEVRPKKGDRLQIAAPWDPARFDFPLPDGMKQRLDRLLAGESSDPSPATDTQRAAPKKDKAPAKPKQPVGDRAAADRTKKAKTVPPKPRPVEVGAATISATSGVGGGRSRGAKKGRSGFVIFSVLGLVAAGTAGAIVLPKMFSSEDGGNTDQRASVPIQNDGLSDDNANDTDESANDTDESANESIGDASTVPQLASCRSQLQDLLSESDRLRVPAAGLVGSQDPAEETIRYTIPGLANGGRAAECAGTDGLSLADPDVIRAAVRAMDRLLDEGWRDPVTDAVRSVLRSDYRDLIDENAGIVAADAPDWQLDTAKRAWSATFGGSVMVGSAPGAFSFDLPNLSLRAADGQVVVMNAAEPMPDLAAVFINLQKSAAQEAANRFQEQAGAELSISYLDFADPTTEMYVTIGDREDRVLQRTVLIPWSAENLDFVDSPQGLDRQLADARAASMLVAAVNGASGGELDDDWIERAAGDGLFREIESEGARVAAATPAPWTDEDDRRVGELAENQRLVIDLPVEVLMGGDSPVTYDDVIALGGPSVWREAAPWTLAMAYGDLVYAEDQPFKEDIDVFLREAQNLRDYLSRDDNRFRVELAFTRPAQPSDGGTPTLVVAGQWVPDPERNYDHDTDKLAEGLAKQIRANETGDAPQGFVSLGIVGGDVELTFDAEAVATSLSEDLGYVLTLESELSAWSARRGAEEELEKALGDVGAIRLDDTRGMLLLTTIWTAKGKEDPGALGFAEFHSDKIPRRSVLKDIAPVRGKLRVTATVFVEYFAGIRATYAIVWSWKSDTSEGRGEGPWLLKLMDKESLDQFGGDLSSLGSTLIEPALNRVREAWRAESYGNQLGIALGVDVPLQHLPWSGMTFKMSNEVVLKTRKRLNIGVAEGSRPIGFDIGSLSDLRGPEVEDRACGYLLLTSLAPPCVELRNPTGNGDVFPAWARSVVLDAALPDG